MKVIITEAADVCLAEIYLYHRGYSFDYAVRFQTKLEKHLVESLMQNPMLGHPYNRDTGLRRLIYRGKYNVYYVTRPDAIYVIYVFDGQRDANQQIARGEIKLPPLEGREG